MRYLIIALLITNYFSFAIAQDEYHQSLIDQLQTENNLENSSFVFYDNENQNISAYEIYGSTMNTTDIDNFSFTRKTKITVNSQGNNPWDAGFGLTNKNAIQQGDIVLLAFWGRRVSSDSDMLLYIEDVSTYEKEVYADFSLTQDWTQFFVAFEASQSFAASNAKFGFHQANIVQEFEIAGFTALNFGNQYELEDIPSIFNPGNYGGNESDAPWRAEAATRINQFRKADLKIKVVDPNGNPVENADIQVDMVKHDFGFGTAVVGCRFPGNDCYNETYVQKLTDLDGEGHGFNMAVTENALKWDGWEEEWIGSPEETKSAVSYLDDLGMKVRGHVLLWPGWSNLPEDMEDNATDLDYLKTRIENRLKSMLQDDVLGDIINDWDVINEITTNRSLEMAFAGSPGYPTGRELYPEVFDMVADIAPNKVNYLNDYVTLSNGGFGKATTDRYKQYVTEIYNSGAKMDGIGFQCHIGSFPTSIYKIEETLNDFQNLFDVEMKVTEYDIDGTVSPEVQASYLRDFMTMIFSHEKMTAFLMWGFWDGNHWKSNAPMFDINWNLKPSGEVFNDLVFNEWWTDENDQSDNQGDATFSVFKGDHKITITKDGESIESTISITEDEDIVLVLGPTAIFENQLDALSIKPNPNNGRFLIENENLNLQNSIIEVRDSQGMLIKEIISNDDNWINLDVVPGVYILSVIDGQNRYIKRVIIK